MVSEKIICPKCGYVRKDTEEAPLWKCPSCDIVYKKYLEQIEPRQRQEAEAHLGEGGDVNKGIDQPKLSEMLMPRKRTSRVMLGGLALLGIVVFATLILVIPSKNKVQKTTNTDMAGMASNKSVSGSAREIIKLAGIALENPKAIEILKESCIPEPGLSYDLYCKIIRPGNDPSASRLLLYPNFVFGSVKTSASLYFSDSGALEYANITLPPTKQTTEMIKLLIEKYGPPLFTEGAYIDPHYSLTIEIPGMTASWRDRLGNELLLQYPGDLTQLRKDREVGDDKYNEIVRLLGDNIKPTIYIHSAALVKRDGGPSNIAKGGNSTAKKKMIEERERAKKNL